MAFDGTEGEFISVDEGAAMTKEWRDKGCCETKGVFYGREKILALLNQAECKGIRMYFAENEKGLKTLVLVGAKADENDILSNNLVLDMGVPCPVKCGDANALNS